MGSDYTQAARSEERHFADALQERADRGEIPRTAVQRMTYHDGETFYGLQPAGEAKYRGAWGYWMGQAYTDMT